MASRLAFKVEREILVDPAVAWSRLSDISAIPQYWRGHKAVEVLEARSGVVLARVKFAFPGPLNEGLVEIAVEEKLRQVLLHYIRGPFNGRVRNYVAGRLVGSEWDISLNPLFLPAKPWIRRHFIKGASNALERIAAP